MEARLAMPKSDPSSLALKPRETSTLPTSSVAMSWASAPPSECPVISNVQSPGVPAVRGRGRGRGRGRVRGRVRVRGRGRVRVTARGRACLRWLRPVAP